MALGLLAAWLVAEALAPTGAGPSPFSLLANWSRVTFFGGAAAAAFALHLASARPGAEKLAAALAGALVAAATTLAGGATIVAIGIGLGIGSASVLATRAWLSKGDDRGSALDVLVPGLFLPGFVIVSAFYLELTATLRPTTWDPWAFAADGAFGLQASFVLGRLFLAFPTLSRLANVIYMLAPLGFVAVESAAARHRSRLQPDPMVAFLAIALAGYVLYFFFPVAGPVFVFPGFPVTSPAPLPLAPLAAVAVPRNCMPSLHTAWALLAFWLARPYGRVLRALLGAFLAVTLLATLGTGSHYLVDLIAAVPFTATVLAAVSPATQGDGRARRRLLIGGPALLAFWLGLVRFAPTALPAPVLWVVALAIVALSTRSVTGLVSSAAAPVCPPPDSRPRVDPGTRRLRAWIGTVYFGSGFAALCYEVVFAKAFAVTYGSTARATTTVLAVYMGGLALGSWLGGRLANRAVRPLRTFALLEIGVAAWCALFPLAIRAVRAAYLAVAAGADPGTAWLVPVQMTLQAAALMPATVLMGCSLPYLARFFTDRDESIGSTVARLYWVNTAGAAAGTVLAGYALLPLLGITRTIYFAVLLDVLVAYLSFHLSRRVESGAAAVPAAPRVLTGTSGAGVGRLQQFAWVALTTALLGGVVTFALETVYMHLLAVVAGNSTYAFSLMVFAFLVGLSVGGATGRRLLATSTPFATLLAYLQAGLAAVIFMSVHLWDAIPGYFASFDGYSRATTFGAREVVRFFASSVAMIPPAIFIGATYAVFMAWVGAASPGRVVAAVGRAGALNTAGNIAGAILGGFLLVPLLGSLVAVQAIAGLALALSALALVAVENRRGPGLALAASASLLAVQPHGLDYTRLASGANVYFAEQSYGRVIDHAESQDGGLTTIAESRDSRGTRVLTMLTNGKFQGDDSHAREMAAQVSFTLLPLLHTDARESALVIGLGTGVSARVASDAGFSDVRVAELSRDVADLAERHFSGVNGNVLSRSGTTLHVTDGRNLLALSPRLYDLVSMEVSSIWFAGAASLYNREFYELARSRLARRGVLQQWVQMHHLSRADILSVLATARSVFPYVWLYFVPNQGVMVACEWDCRPSPASVDRLVRTPRLAADLASVGGVAQLLDERVLGPADVDRLLGSLREWRLSPDDLVSTDDNLLLEYSTPRGNVREAATSLRDNLGFVGRFRPASPLAGTALGEKDLAELRSSAPSPPR